MEEGGGEGAPCVCQLVPEGLVGLVRGAHGGKGGALKHCVWGGIRKLEVWASVGECCRKM